MGKKLQYLNLHAGGIIDPDIVPYSNIKSMSSDDFQKYLEKDQSLFADKYDIFCKGLSECTAVRDLELFPGLNNEHFLNKFEKSILENQKDRKLVMIKNPTYRTLN